MIYTKHAMRRTQERGIPVAIVDLVLEYGTARRQADGTCRYELHSQDKHAAIRQLRQQLQYLEKANGKVVIADGDRVVTVFQRS